MKHQTTLTFKIFIIPYVILFSLAILSSIIFYIITMDSTIFEYTINILNPLTHTSYRTCFCLWIGVSALFGYVFSH